MSALPRRQFVAAVGTGVLGAAFGPVLHASAEEIEALVPERGAEPPERTAEDEAFWRDVRRAFDVPNGLINLDNGNISPASLRADDEVARQVRATQPFPVTRFKELGRSLFVPMAGGLSRLLGVSMEELAATRNATESLDTVILGVPLERGDEIVCSAHDYYAMRDAIEQRERRDGVVMRAVAPPVPLRSDDELVNAYEREMGPRTRLVLVTHPSNLTGQLAPVRRIADAAHRVGALVVVDGAQSMALVPYTMAELGCDYFGASLHKWLMAPVGLGVLWMRPELVERTWPLLPPSPGARGMNRFMASGTFPLYISAATVPAMELHERIGTVRKGARLRHLTRYWRTRAERLPGVRFYTTADDAASCGMATLELEGVDHRTLQAQLWERDHILVQAMTGGRRAPEIHGIRVTPSVFTTLAELDRFGDALERVATRGL